jgi:hypothetical protein
MQGAKFMSRTDKVKDSPNPIFWLTTIPVIISTFIFLWGVIKFSLSSNSNKEELPYLAFLFALPLILQIIGLVVLYNKFGQDASLKKFFWFYLTWMSFCLIGYPLFWVLYSFGIYAQLQNWALGLSLILLLPVASMTYTIMTPPNKNNPTEDSGDGWTHKLKRRLEYCILLKDMKDSVVRVPYWALLFFFTLYLGITYLFGFAFAFHAMAVKESFETHNVKVSERIPALYLTKLAPDAKEAQPPTNKEGGGTVIVDGDTREFKFYFENLTAYSKYKSEAFDKKAYDNESRRNKEWRESKNAEHILNLVQEIITATEQGKKIRLELRGQANEIPVKQGIVYPSNYELSEARAHNIQSEVLRRISKDNILRSIEWYCLPLSSELPLDPENEENNAITIEYFKSQILGSSKITPAEKTRLMGKLKEIESKVLKQENQGTRRGNLPAIPQKPKPTQHVIPDKTATPSHVRYLVKRLQQVMVLAERDDLTPEKKRIKLDQRCEEFDEDLQAIDYIEDDAKERIVTVTVNLLQTTPEYTYLSLMDYIYFATIGIGGEIMPTTKYAKFLCSLSGILQIFFLVVFFNALLTLKEDRKEDRSNELPPDPPHTPPAPPPPTGDKATAANTPSETPNKPVSRPAPKGIKPGDKVKT